MQYKGKTLTDEQESALNTIVSGGNYVIQAPPGSGKTFLLLATARKMRGSGLNVTFNRLLAQQAQAKFARHVQAKTGHALAFGQLGYKFKDRLQKITGASLAREYDLGDISLYRTPAHKGYLILNTIRKYCYSSDEYVNKSHIPHIPIGPNTNLSAIQEDLVTSAKPILNLMFDESKSIPITHDIYLKKWALSNPILKKDFILFDEYQDANPVISQVILNQDSQLLFVGDMFQQIYSWRGAVNAISGTDLPILNITQSFRFGQPIADLANKIIQSYYPTDFDYTPFQGHPDIGSTVSSKPAKSVDCIICRTNNGVITETISALANDLKVYINGGVQNLISLIRGIDDLKHQGKSFHPELFLFNSFDELMEYANSSFGGDLKPTIKLMDKYGKDKLLKLLNETERNDQYADVTITTAHKAKGLEWPTIRLGSDFLAPEENTLPSTEETNILYVATTRALKHIDTSKCQAVSPTALSEARKINQKHKEFLEAQYDITKENFNN